MKRMVLFVLLGVLAGCPDSGPAPASARPAPPVSAAPAPASPPLRAKESPPSPPKETPTPAPDLDEPVPPPTGG